MEKVLTNKVKDFIRHEISFIRGAVKSAKTQGVDKDLIDYFLKLKFSELREVKRVNSIYTRRVEARGFNKITIWTPKNGTDPNGNNRGVAENLNHILCGFKDGELIGENGNCGTLYKITIK